MLILTAENDQMEITSRRVKMSSERYVARSAVRTSQLHYWHRFSVWQTVCPYVCL